MANILTRLSLAFMASVLCTSLAWASQDPQAGQSPATQPSGDAGQGAMRRLPPPNPNAGYLGAKFSQVTDEAMEELKLDSSDGVIVVEIMDGSPAQKSGLVENDIIRQIDGNDVADVEAFVGVMQKTKPGQDLKLTVFRAGEKKELPVTLGKRPPGFGQQPPSGEDKMPKDAPPAKKD